MNLFASMSLRAKLILSFAVVLIITTLTIVIINQRSIRLEERILAERTNNVSLFDLIIQSKTGYLKGFAKNFALHPKLVTFVASADPEVATQDTLGQAQAEIQQWLSAYIGAETIHTIVVTDAEGRVIGRGSSPAPAKHLFLSAFVSRALNGQFISGIEQINKRDFKDDQLNQFLSTPDTEPISTGLLLRATAPVQYFQNGQQKFGTLTAGYFLNYDSYLAKSCREKLNSVEEAAIYHSDYKIAGNGNFLPEKLSLIPELSQKLNESGFVWTKEGRHFIFSQQALVDIEGKDVGTLVMIEFDPTLDAYHFRRGLQLALFLVLAILISSFSLALIDRYLTRPITGIHEAIVRAENGDYSTRVTHTGDDELGQLGQCFNSMIDKIENMVEQERQRREELQLLNDSTKMISVIHDLELLWHLIMERVITVMKVEACSLYLKDPHSEQLECKLSGGSGTGGVDANLLATGAKIAEQVAKTGIVQRLKFDRARSVNGRLFDTLISAPLIARNETIGALNIYNKESGHDFSDNDVSLLSTLAGQAAISINNAILYKEVGERERMKKELEIARTIQKELRPSNVPSIENLMITASIKHVDEMGSNFLDFYPNSDGSRVVVAIGNVFNKGVEAQIVKMMFKTVLQCLAGQIHSPKDALTLVNEIMAGNLEEKDLMALFYGVWDSKDRKFTYANAGHDHPLFYRHHTKDIEKLEQRGRLIGKYNDFELLIKDSDVTVNPDDKLILFTAGLLNCKNNGGNSFGIDKLINIARENGHLDAPELRKLVLDLVSEHCNKVEPAEDITLLVMQGR